MIRIALPLSALALAGCEPISVRFAGGEPVPVDPDLWPSDPDVTPEVSVEQQAVTCDAPQSRAGAYFEQVDDLPVPSTEGNWLWAGGIIAADFNDDGWLDLVAPTETHAKMYQGQAGAPPKQREALAAFDLSYGVGGSAADFDGDGDLDLYVLRYTQPGASPDQEHPNVLLRNDGDGQFTDVSAASGLGIAGASMASTWSDYDLDGDLDVFVAGYGSRFAVDVPDQPSRSWLFENQGDGTFVDVSDGLPEVAQDGYTMSAGFHDVNRDGWPDLYLVSDIAATEPNLLLINREGELTIDHDVLGLDLATSGTGLGVGDLNEDGLPDFLIPRWHQVGVMLSDFDQQLWVDAGDAVGVRPLTDCANPDWCQEVGWGSELADLDNDGDLDGIVAFGRMDVTTLPYGDTAFQQPDALWINDGELGFRDAAAEWGIDDPGTGRGFAVVDLNRDGWLDLAKRDLDGPDVMYVSRCGHEAWLRIELRAPGHNRFAVGARVAVSVGARTQEQTIRAGGTGFGYGGPPEVHFGLGDADSARIDVLWPDGMRTRVDDIDPRQVVTITRLE